MSYYHMSMSNVSRAAGSSSLATASYITGELIHDEFLEGKVYSYGNKERILEHDIVLPDHTDPKLNNVEALFNSIEQFETGSNARTAKKIVVALPEECDIDTHRKIIKQYIEKNITAEGYACCYALHLNNAGTNPHAHILIANRQIDVLTGTWKKTKYKKEYALDNNGNKIPVIDPTTGKQKLGPRNTKVWKRINVEVNPLDKKEKLQSMRESWAKCCNKYLSADNQITHLSHKERGLITEPTIHEGYYARKIEQEGKISDLCEKNREIKKINAELVAEFNSNKESLKKSQHKLSNYKLIEKGFVLDEQRNDWQRIKRNTNEIKGVNTEEYKRYSNGCEIENALQNSMLQLRGSSLVFGGRKGTEGQLFTNKSILKTQMSLQNTWNSELQRADERRNTRDKSLLIEPDYVKSDKPAISTAPDPAANASSEPVQQTQPSPVSTQTVESISSPKASNPMRQNALNNLDGTTSTASAPVVKDIPEPVKQIQPPSPSPVKKVRTRSKLVKPTITVGDWIRKSTTNLKNIRGNMLSKLASARGDVKICLKAGIKYCDTNLNLLAKAPASLKTKSIGGYGASMPSSSNYNQSAEKSLSDLIKWATDATSCDLGKDLGIVGISGMKIESDIEKKLEQSIIKEEGIDIDD